MSTTSLLQTASVTALVALVAVLGVRTALAERAAGSGSGRPPIVRRLDLAATLLAVLCVGALVTAVVAGLLVWT